MKKFLLAGCLMAGTSVFAQNDAADSLKVINLQEVQVVSTRATKKTPVAFTNVSKELLRKQNFGQDIPFLLTTTPSVLTTSDAGTGVGYTSIRVRGTDASRINVTANGIPMNDAESHSIFWVNTPDLASSLQDMQTRHTSNTSTSTRTLVSSTLKRDCSGKLPPTTAHTLHLPLPRKNLRATITRTDSSPNIPKRRSYLTTNWVITSAKSGSQPVSTFIIWTTPTSLC